ncbi:MAG: hypothetical protein WCT25_03635 [Candidatus Paceibacterota bacterium]
MKTETVAKTPIPVDEILTHARAHWDELVAWKLLIWYGEKFFPGISKAKLFFAGATTEGTDAMFDQRKILRIACGGRFDEHRNGGSGRIPGKCSTILVADYIELADAPYLRRLFKETLECDERNVSATRFPQIMKAAYRAFPNDPAFIFRKSQCVVAAIIKAEMCQFAPKANEPTLTSLFEEVLKERAEHFTDEKAIEHIKRLYAESDRAGEEFVTELSFIVKAMFRRDDPIKDISDWVWFVSGILYADQVAFRTARDFCKANAVEHRVVMQNGRHLRLGVVQTDLESALQVMLYFKYDIVIIKNGKGQVQVCTAKSARERHGVNLGNFVRMWRWLELPVQDKETYTWQQLGVAGNHEGVDTVYYHRGSQEASVENAYNGTTTHPNVPPTRVALDMLVNCIQHAFTVDGVAQWMRGRAVRMEKRVKVVVPKATTPKPQPAVEAVAPQAPVVASSEPKGPVTDVEAAFAKAAVVDEGEGK